MIYLFFLAVGSVLVFAALYLAGSSMSKNNAKLRHTTVVKALPIALVIFGMARMVLPFQVSAERVIPPPINSGEPFSQHAIGEAIIFGFAPALVYFVIALIGFRMLERQYSK